MAENVFILGAGASFESGAPLMGNFLDIAEELYIRGVNDKEAFKTTFDIIAELQSVHYKSYLNLDNIEALFGAIEMGKIIDRLGSRKGLEISAAREALVTLIVNTLENSIKFPANQSRIFPTPSYNDFVDLIKNLKNTSVITFNYDIALDFALHWNNVPINYCLSEEVPYNEMKIMKLHGSVNWARCSECKEIVPFLMSEFLRKVSFNIWSDTKNVQININRFLNKIEHCGEIENSPVIVPPTWNKTDYHGTLTNVWKHAADELSSAKNIFVIGYSLPESDAFFRYLFSLGTVGETRIQRFWVFDPNDTGEVSKRYLNIVGQGITNRYKYHTLKFSDAITVIKRELKVENKQYV